MKDVFSFILAVTLVCLYVLNRIGNVPVTPLVALSLVFFLSSVAVFYFKKYTVSYILVSIAIGLLFGIGLVKDRIRYENTVPTDIPTGEYITVTGRRGGSAITCAALNALATKQEILP